MTFLSPLASSCPQSGEGLIVYVPKLIPEVCHVTLHEHQPNLSEVTGLCHLPPVSKY
jgi:hypothetical protein